MPFLATLWFMATTPIVMVDAIFVLTRALPESCADPRIHPLEKYFPFKLWSVYASYDNRYYPNDDAFVTVQSYLNLLEVILGLLAVVLTLLKFHRAGLGLGMIVSVMTVYKTVMYFLMELMEDGKYTKHNTMMENSIMVWLPSSFWIVIPTINFFQIFSSYSKYTISRGLSEIKAAIQNKRDKQK